MKATLPKEAMNTHIRALYDSSTGNRLPWAREPNGVYGVEHDLQPTGHAAAAGSLGKRKACSSLLTVIVLLRSMNRTMVTWNRIRSQRSAFSGGLLHSMPAIIAVYLILTIHYHHPTTPPPHNPTTTQPHNQPNTRPVPPV